MGSSGGGSSGAVSHSAYLEKVHNDWLDATGTDSIEKSITEVMDSALGSSPWTGKAAYNPDVPIAAYEAAMAAFRALLSGISDTAAWNSFFTQASASLGAASSISDAAIVADVAAFAGDLDDDIVAKVLPRYRRGMQDINSVVSSAFAIGESVIEGFRLKAIAKHDSELRVEAAKLNATMVTENKRLILEGSGQILRLMLQRIAFESEYARMSVESNRIKIVAKKEQTDQDDTIDEQDALWDLEVFQYGSNVLAGIAGGTSGNKLKAPSKTASVIGGAMTGAAAGAMVGAEYGSAGGPYGAIIGAVLGAAAGFLAS